MDQSTFNHGNTGDTNPKGRSRSPLLELYTRSLRNEREEKIGHRTSAACGGRLRLCYTLDEGKESERETTNCPPKRVRSKEKRTPMLRSPACSKSTRTDTRFISARCMRFPGSQMKPRIGSSAPTRKRTRSCAISSQSCRGKVSQRTLGSKRSCAN